MARIVGDTLVPDPDDYKILSGTEVIWRNSARCNNCEKEVESAYRWDFRSCECGNVAVDGGYDYLRRVFGDKGYKDTSIVINGS